MQVPELLRGRLHNLRSSYLKRAVQICRQSVRQYAPCHVRLRVWFGIPLSTFVRHRTLRLQG